MSDHESQDAREYSGVESVDQPEAGEPQPKKRKPIPPKPKPKPCRKRWTKVKNRGQYKSKKNRMSDDPSVPGHDFASTSPSQYQADVKVECVSSEAAALEELPADLLHGADEHVGSQEVASFTGSISPTLGEGKREFSGESQESGAIGKPDDIETPSFQAGNNSPEVELPATDSDLHSTGNKNNVQSSGEPSHSKDLSREQFIDEQPRPELVMDSDKSKEAAFVLLEEVRKRLSICLPNLWVPIVVDDGIFVGSRVKSKVLIVQKSLFVEPNGAVAVGVHGKKLPDHHQFWQSVKEVHLSASSVNLFVTNIQNMVAALRVLEVCCGVQDFKNEWKHAENCVIDNNDFQEARHGVVCRSVKCYLLVPGLKTKRCGPCNVVWKILSKRYRAHAGETVVTPPKNKPDKFLTTPEKERRLTITKEENRKIKLENSRLKKKLKSLVETEGVAVGDSVSSDLVSILGSPEAQEGLTDMQRMFIEEQIKAGSVKGASGMRWHPALIRLALSIRMTSAAAYEELSTVLRLPSERQLYDYTHAIQVEGNYDELLKHNSR